MYILTGGNVLPPWQNTATPKNKKIHTLLESVERKMYDEGMMSEESIKRIARINERLERIESDDLLTLETYEDVLLLKLDVEWLCANLSSAWSVVRDYQEELNDLHKECS